MQLQWFGNSDGGVPQVAAYNLVIDEIQIRLLNADAVGKHHETSAALAEAARTNRNNPSLYRGEMTFKKTGT